MKSFLLHNNKPTVKWGLIPDNIFYEGIIPKGYGLAVCPSGTIIILDVDVKNGKNGYSNIPFNIYSELEKTFRYNTKSGGGHYWINYSGTKDLMNTSTKYGLDLRIGAKGNNAGGYVKYHHNVDIRKCVEFIKVSSSQLNTWLESLFCSKK